MIEESVDARMPSTVNLNAPAGSVSTIRMAASARLESIAPPLASVHVSLLRDTDNSWSLNGRAGEWPMHPQLPPVVDHHHANHLQNGMFSEKVEMT